MYNRGMKRQPSRKARAMRSESSDAESTTQIDPRRITRRQKIEYIDSPVADPEPAPEWADGELEFAGPQPRR